MAFEILESQFRGSEFIHKLISKSKSDDNNRPKYFKSGNPDPLPHRAVGGLYTPFSNTA